jgi:O-antigen ligase
LDAFDPELTLAPSVRYTPWAMFKPKHIERFIFFLLVASFFVPLIMVPSSFIFPFIVPKIVVFRGLVLTMLAGFLALLFTNRERYGIRMTPVTMAVLLFLLSFGMSTFIGVDWYHSFWDNHERMLGLFTIVHYVLYYLIATSVIKDERDWMWLLRAFLFAGSIVMFIGVLQHFNPTLLLNQSGSRVASTLGNPIYVGGYGLFLSFVGFIGIFLSGTRGSILGWLSGTGVMFLLYAFLIKDHPKLRRIMRGVTIAGVAMLALLFAFRTTPFVRDIPALGNLLNTSLSYGTGRTRLMAWGIAVDAWKERPVFGWGPNNYFYAFNQYYRPEFLEHGWGETWFDNAHNIVMNTLAVQGLVGVILYFGVFGTVILYLWKRYREGATDIHLPAILTGFFIAHLIGNVSVFLFHVGIRGQHDRKKNRGEKSRSVRVHWSSYGNGVYHVPPYFCDRYQCSAREPCDAWYASQSVYVAGSGGIIPDDDCHSFTAY